jgi:effector-binding domain-containing protein
LKKFFQFLGILFAIVILAILVFGLVEPRDIIVKRSILVQAPKDSVFEQVVNFKNWPNWSPWQKLDSGMKTTYEGVDGQPGSGYTWAGDENKVGSGEMKSTAVQGTNMQYDFHLNIKPWQLNATGSLDVKDTTNGNVLVTWTFNKHSAYPFNAAAMFLDLEKWMGPDLETGLQNIKKYTESHAPAVEKIDIKEVEYKEHTFEGIRKTVSWNDMMKFFNECNQLVIKDVDGKINGVQVGLFYDWDTVNKRADLAAAFPVSDTATPIKGTTFFHAGPAKALLAVEKGGYAKSQAIHEALTKYAASKGQTVTLKIEEYITGPKQDANSNNWVTNIYYLVK